MLFDVCGLSLRYTKEGRLVLGIIILDCVTFHYLYTGERRRTFSAPTVEFHF
jgi:hypothetical protein